MKLSLIKIAIFSIMSIILFAEFCLAKPFGNQWHARDPRCKGGSFQGIRLKRSATSNNFAQGSYHFKFDPNHDKCEKIFGSSGADYQSFETLSECESNCLDIYHFS